jgi:class 3 adenylate cyclase
LKILYGDFSAQEKGSGSKRPDWPRKFGSVLGGVGRGGLMTTHSDEITEEEKVVVFFDICSSSMMMEDLLQHERLQALRDLLISVKKFLLREREGENFIIYKFIGDGWILLFPPSVSGTELINFVTRLSNHFAKRFRKYVSRKLQCRPKVVGLTFGVDEGSLIKTLMDNRDEYIGRALNVASRLQGAIKEKDKDPAYKVLISRPAFYSLRIPKDICKVERARRRLRNISNNKLLEYRKLTLSVSER